MMSFYHSFDPMSKINMSLAIGVCIAVFILFVIGMVASYVADKYLIPQHEKIIELHRLAEYADKDLDGTGKDQPSDPHVSNNPLMLVDSAEESEDGNLSGEMEEEVKMEVGAGDEAPRPRKLKKPSRKNMKKEDNGGSGGDNNGSGGSSPDEKLNPQKPAAVTVVDLSQAKAEVKEGGDNTNNTTQNHNTTQELTATPYGRPPSGGSQKSNEDASPDKLFTGVQAGEIRRKDKENTNQKIVNIFSKDHLERREIEKFQFLNLLLGTNFITSIWTRTNTVFTRISRCFLLFSHIYLILFWAAILITNATPILDHPEEVKSIPYLLADDVWMLFFTPFISAIVLYLLAGMLKVSETQVQQTKTMGQYRRTM